MSPAAFTSWTPETAEELWVYFSFMILMGINSLPALSNHWKLDPTFRYSPIADRITRDRFLEISRYLHFADNTTLASREDPAYN